MKKTVFFILAIVAFSFQSCDKDEVVSEGSLPTAASDFIKAHFPDETVLQVKKEKDFLKKTVYEVILSNTFELEFKDNGEAKKVDGNGEAIPTAVVKPEAVVDYVNENFEGKQIVSWEKDADSKGEVEVELNNGLDLKFDKEGKFLRIDD